MADAAAAADDDDDDDDDLARLGSRDIDSCGHRHCV